MDKKRLSKKIVNEVTDFVNYIKKDDLDIDKVIVFGSQTKGNARLDSDIDVCIVSESLQNEVEALRYLWKKKALLADSIVEPVGYTKAEFKDDSNPLVCEIKKYGIELKI